MPVHRHIPPVFVVSLTGMTVEANPYEAVEVSSSISRSSSMLGMERFQANTKYLTDFSEESISED